MYVKVYEIFLSSCQVEGAVRDTDVAGFLKKERENAILSVIEETRRDTFEAAEKLAWEATLNEWDATKRQVLEDLSGIPDVMGAAADAYSSAVEVTRVHDSTSILGGVGAATPGGSAGLVGCRASNLNHLEMAYAK